MIEKVDLRGLRTALKKYSRAGLRETSGRWSVGSGAHDLWWELYYDGTPVISCLRSDKISKDGNRMGRLQNDCLAMEDFDRVCKAIMGVFPDCYPMRRYAATGIEWDVDEEDTDRMPDIVYLPMSMVDENGNYDEDEVSDYISDTEGFCHKGFVIERIA